jgi:Fe2+ transport system protein FeoA
MPTDHLTPLSALRPPQEATVLRVSGGEPAFLRHLDELGLVPGAQIEVTAYSSFDNNLTIAVPGQPSTVLGLAITSKIYVEVI